MEIGDGIRFGWQRFGDFSAAQLYDLLRLRQAIFVVEQSSPFPDLDGLDHAADHLLLWQEGEIAGCLRLIPYLEEGRAAIGRLAVAPTLRRRGLARGMMQEALARCRRDYPLCTVAVSAQAYLAPFYAGLGFRQVSSPWFDYGVAHVEMVRDPALTVP